MSKLNNQDSLKSKKYLPPNKIGEPIGFNKFSLLTDRPKSESPPPECLSPSSASSLTSFRSFSKFDNIQDWRNKSISPSSNKTDNNWRPICDIEVPEQTSMSRNTSDTTMIKPKTIYPSDSPNWRNQKNV